MQKLKVGELVLDYSLYPRDRIDSQHVSYMMRSLEAGATFEPPIADQKSKRITDGFHRVTMYKRKYGDAHEIEVALKRYKTEQDMFLDAIRYNASHGRNLTTHDRARCAILGHNFGIDDSALAEALSVDPSYVGKLRTERTAGEPIKPSKTAGQPITPAKLVPLKRTVSHMAGRELTERQVEANRRLSGMNQTFYVNQVIELIESGMLNTADEVLLERLKVLGEAIEWVFATA